MSDWMAACKRAEAIYEKGIVEEGLTTCQILHREIDANAELLEDGLGFALLMFLYDLVLRSEAQGQHLG